MKTRVFGAILGLLLPCAVWAQLGDGEKFDSWHDNGCVFYPGQAGQAPSGTTGTGGNQAQCIACEGGMPRWWIDEPYINLHIADDPLSYTTSSGKEMSFRFLYKQRYEVPKTNECWDFYHIGGNPLWYRDTNGERYLRDMRSYNMTNGSWSHNWMMNIEFWNPNWENSGGGSPNSNTFQTGYEALVFHPEGGIDYFPNTNGVIGFTPTDPQSQRGLQPLSRYPLVAASPSKDGNSNYWGDDGCGFRMNYPDGSVDVFSLTFYVNDGTGPSDTSAHALLTQRIDPQGRVTLIGYEDFYPYTDQFNNTYGGYRVKYVVDPDGRTNTFQYFPSGSKYAWQLSEIDDPFGRKAQFGYDGYGHLYSITDAANNTTIFHYQGANGWITNLTTPYGTTSFNFYQSLEPGTSDTFLERAAYVSEPLGAGQLFYYRHQTTTGVPTSVAVPTDHSYAFDSGANGGSSAPQMTQRNSFHWDRRQFAHLSTNVTAHLSNLQVALSDLTAADYTKARLSHWMFQSDGVTLSDTMSAQRDPSPDPGGVTNGNWTFFAHLNGLPDMLDNPPGVQIAAIARLLPDGTTSQYVNYAIGSTAVTTAITLPNGSTGERTNWFTYPPLNTADLKAASNSLGQFVNFGYANHALTSITDVYQQTTLLTYDPTTQNLTGISNYTGQTVGLAYYGAASPPTSTSSMLSQNRGGTEWTVR